MSGPFPLPQIRPDVVTGTGAPDFWSTLLNALPQGAQIGAQGYAQSQENSRSSAQIAVEKARIDLEREKEKTRQAELRIQQANAEAQGAAMKDLIPHLIATGQLPPGSLGMGGQAGPANQPAPMQMGAGLPGQQMVSQQPVVQPQGQLDPMAALGGAIQNLPNAAVQGFLQHALPITLDAQKSQAQAQQLALVNQTIANVPVAQQAPLRALFTLTNANKDLPKEVLKSLFPQFYAQNEPETVNAFTTAFRTGSFTAGQAALMTGMQLPQDVDKGLKYPLAALLGRGANQQAERAANFLGIMQTTAPIIDALVQKTGGISFLGELKKNQRPAEGIFGSIRNAVENGLISNDQQQLVTAMQNFANAWRFAISGAASTDKEFETILNSSVEQINDQPETKQFKSNLRHIMIQGVADMAARVRTRSQVLEAALRQPWPKEQRQFLEQQLIDAKMYEGKIKGGTDPFIPDPSVPGSPDAMQKQLDEIRSMINASNLGIKP